MNTAISRDEASGAPSVVALGWDRPLLEKAVEDLAIVAPALPSDIAGAPPLWDLSGVVVVTPTARSGRRLLDLLAARAQQPSSSLALVPPRILTVGAIPSALGVAPLPAASRIEALFGWIAAMNSVPQQQLQTVAPSLGTERSAVQLLGLAERLASAHDELALAGFTMQQVAEEGMQHRGFPDTDRWKALAEIEKRYLEELNRNHLSDPMDLAAIQPRADGTIGLMVLVGVTDLPVAVRRFLEDLRTPIRCLVHAPADELHRFDEYGCVRTDKWLDRHINLPEEIIVIANEPRDQAFEALRLMHTLAKEYGTDEFSLGLGDTALLPFVRRTLDAANIPIHAAYGRPLSATQPLQLLGAIGDYLSAGDAESAAALLRHPDLDRWTGSDQHLTSSLGSLDRYRKDHLPSTMGRPYPDSVKQCPSLSSGLSIADQTLQRIARSLRIADRGALDRRPLPEWAEPLGELLASVYEAQELKAEPAVNSLSARADLIGSVEETARLLSEIAGMNSALASAVPVTATEAIRILRRIAARVAVPETYGPPAVEVLDWIEMHSDDAPVKIILGMNEGCVPEPMTGDPLIPDNLRKVLGITDSAARYARDAYLLTALGASTPHLALIAGTTNAVGEPVPPSRLLLACDGDALVNRAQRFFSGRNATHSGVTLYAAGQHSQYTPIRPVKPETPIRELSATAFRDYLACPYRFYLKHVLRLESVDDRAENLDAAQFGSLLHEVIGEFSRNHLDDNIDVDQTFGVLRDILRSRAIAHFGSKPIVTVNLQLEQIATRLERFAAWHCYRVQNGWVTQPDWTERLAEVSLDVDGVAVTVHGRIDRIDYNPQEGKYVVVDYKSSEARPDPERTHRRADGTTRVWTDLQLPLYRLMVMKTILDASAQDVGTALLWLPPDQQGPDNMLFEAAWSEADYASAEECAVSVVRRIFAGEFWPPAAEPPRYDDGLRAICMDDCSDRFSLLRNPQAPWDNP